MNESPISRRSRTFSGVRTSKSSGKPRPQFHPNLDRFVNAPTFERSDHKNIDIGVRACVASGVGSKQNDPLRPEFLAHPPSKLLDLIHRHHRLTSRVQQPSSTHIQYSIKCSDPQLHEQTSQASPQSHRYDSGTSSRLENTSFSGNAARASGSTSLLSLVMIAPARESKSTYSIS